MNSEGRLLSTEFRAISFGLLCGGLSTYEERQLERPGHFISTRHTLLDLLYRIDELPRDTEVREIERTVAEIVDCQQRAITAAWRDASEAYASIQAAVATAGKLKFGRRRSKREPPASRSTGDRLAPRSSVARVREIITAIRRMIPNAVYSRPLGAQLQQLVAGALPECAQLAREIRETMHDLDHGEPNVTVSHLEQCLASLENELDRFEQSDS